YCTVFPDRRTGNIQPVVWRLAVKELFTELPPPPGPADLALSTAWTRAGRSQFSTILPEPRTMGLNRTPPRRSMRLARSTGPLRLAGAAIALPDSRSDAARYSNLCRERLPLEDDKAVSK